MDLIPIFVFRFDLGKLTLGLETVLVSKKIQFEKSSVKTVLVPPTPILLWHFKYKSLREIYLVEFSASHKARFLKIY